jgi:hypothetical protein
MGSGKTSLINGFITVFRESQEVLKELSAYRSDTHVTKSYSANMLANSLHSELSSLEQNIKSQLKIQMWDPWGLTQSNYKRLSILHFMEGRVPEGNSLNDNPCLNPVNNGNIIDAVIFLIPVGTSQDAELLEVLAHNIQSALEAGIRPVIVINYLNTVKSEDELSTACNTIFTHTHLALNDIFKIDNYDNETVRNMDKELQYWKILKKAFAEASKNIRNRSRHKPSTPKPQITINPPIHSDNICNICNKSYSKVYPVCPYCGGGVPHSNRICLTHECKNFKKEVEFPLCPFCGKTPKEPESAKTFRSCASQHCKNFGKEVAADFPLCPFCGNAPKNNRPQSDLPVKKQKICPRKNCKNFGKEVSAEFPRCPFCGSNTK